MDDAFVVDEAAGPNLDGGATRARVDDKLAAPARDDAHRVLERERRDAVLALDRKQLRQRAGAGMRLDRLARGHREALGAQGLAARLVGSRPERARTRVVCGKSVAVRVDPGGR